MNSPSPGELQIGLNGTLGGRRYRVAGRVVMQVEIGGETYSWDEFNLQEDNGRPATLVREETETGLQWRLFTLFEPPRPISVAEAATKRAGDTVTIEGIPARVTLADESRVAQIEGQAPEGVELGDVAKYLNVEAGGQLWVISWTGDEIEYYRGMNLPAEVVARAFGLSGAAAAPARLASPGANGSPGRSIPWQGILGIIVFLAVFGTPAWEAIRKHRVKAQKASQATPASPLKLGATGRLAGTQFTVRGHALVEIARMSARFERHEYELAAGDGARRLLVFGTEPGQRDWVLFEPVPPDVALRPHEAAALRVGDVLRAEGHKVTVADHLLGTFRQVEGEWPATFATGSRAFHFRGRLNDEPWLARWNEHTLEVFRGLKLKETNVPGAFGAK